MSESNLYIFRTLFGHALDDVLLTSPDGSILLANPAAYDLFERDERALRDMGRLRVVGIADERLTAALALGERTGSFRGDLTFIRANGERLPAEVSSAAFDSENGQPLTSLVIRDSSNRERAEEAPRRSEARYRTLVAALEGGVVLQVVDGTIFACNASAERMLSLTEDQPVELTAYDLRWRAVREDGRMGRHYWLACT